MLVNPLQEIYQKLMDLHGAQGWWPVGGHYHPGDFSFPRNKREQYEICLGAILTQNTAWTNVEKALGNLQEERLLHPEKIRALSSGKLEKLLLPSGYYKQKAKKIRIFTEFFIEKKGQSPCREELLALWGIGPETADSMLLYAYNSPTFVVDAYTKRMLAHLKLIEAEEKYDIIKKMFEDALPLDLKIYQEYHALIVQHGKKYYSKKPYGINCPLYEMIK